ncbi:MAG: nitroreductase, partial [Cohaesibacteraceae bacterium]|nr:nitroreductase [Cohaesibacteraceae bacterium]
MKSVLDFLLSRRSVTCINHVMPGPDQDQLDLILTAAMRVPDHGKLTPWRFVLFKGNARSDAGSILADRWVQLHPDAPETRVEQERFRFTRSPVVLAIISSITISEKVPNWEQYMSAGACCMNAIHAAEAQGFCAQWLTEWYAFDEEVLDRFGLSKEERIAGFI